MAEQLPVRDALVSFAAREPLRAALFLTYSFDGRWFEEALVPDLCERSIATMLIVRDRNAITSEAPSVRYRKANACASTVFHPKLALLVTEDRARAVISSANLTRGGFERQRELGRVFDLGPNQDETHRLFESLLKYLEEGISTEVRGESSRDLAEIITALREVLTKYKAPAVAGPHKLLHNYAESIWTLMRKNMPHFVLRRAIIVSPFFEPDRKHPEDPALGPQDHSIFARMLLKDFEFDTPDDEVAVRVFFRESGGRTELPIGKLRKLEGKVAFFAQNESDQRLHAKLIMLEGSEGPGREPFLLALHGSPNFTTAGLLQRPPTGNSELALLTMLPTKRNSLHRSIHVLGLERGFTQTKDLSTLRAVEVEARPHRLSQGVADATYRVAEQVVAVSLLQATPAGARVRLLLQRNGAWAVIGEADGSAVTEVVIPVAGLAEVDGKTKLLELRATTVRVDVVDSNGRLIISNSVPINVDEPEDFCGLTLVGAALLTLEERIARAGFGVSVTYREQLKWLETSRSKEPGSAGSAVVAHCADLDRFYRNVHLGLRGILARTRPALGSEFAVRRSLDMLCRWALEATVSDALALTIESRLFLLERVLRAAIVIVNGCSAQLKTRLPAIAADVHLSDSIGLVISWLDGIEEPALAAYAAGTRAHARDMLGSFNNGPET